MSSSVKKIEARIVDLEVRLMHQESSLENLTLASVRQQRVIDEVLEQLKLLREMLRHMDEPSAPPGSGPPPPHY